VPPVKIRIPGRTRKAIYTDIEELDLREELLELYDQFLIGDGIDLREELTELLDEDSSKAEIDLREEFEDWMHEYDPNKKRN